MMNKVSYPKRVLDGILVVNKSQGMTSHDVVSQVRRKFNMRRVGHAGTLDPLATGVLVILLGKNTKLFDKFRDFDKAYRATMILGMKTTTADIEGDVVGRAGYEGLTEKKVKDVFREFLGSLEQVPPMYSAVKIKGKKLYELARKGIVVDRPARAIRIDELKLLNLDLPRCEFSLKCSKGTYVRQLAEDIGEKLGTVACIERIERTAVGPFTIEEAKTLEDCDESCIRQWRD